VLFGSAQDADGTVNPLTNNIQDVLDEDGFPYEGMGLGFGNGIIDDERLGLTNTVMMNNSGGLNFNTYTSGGVYNAMQSKYENGMHMTYGGSGGTGSVETSFIFPGDTDPLGVGTGGVVAEGNWSEVTEGNIAEDRRVVASSGPFTFGSDTLFFDVSFVTGMENTTAGYTSHEAMIENVDSVRNYFVANETSCGDNFDFYEPFDGPYLTIGMIEEKKSELLVYPNPSIGEFNVAGLEVGSTILITDINGKSIKTVLVQSENMIINLNVDNGIYFVNVITGDQMKHIKIIKQ
jgi:hypothetical protein